jgi:uncharacterized protein Veg
MRKVLNIIIFILISLIAYSQNSIETKKLVIFTDGNSYVMKEGKVNTQNKSYLLEKDQLPIARYGTLFISDTERSLKYVSSYIDQDLNKTKPQNIVSVLTNNIGKQIEIKTNSEINIGKIINVFPGYLIIEADQETIIKLDNILSFKFLDKLKISSANDPAISSRKYDNYGREIKNENVKSKLILHFENEGSKNIEMSYLQKGVSWNPNYRLNLKDNNRANLSLQAEIINDIENFENTEVELVVGKPNFQYHEYLTDLIDYNNTLDPYYEKPKNNNNYYNSGISLDEVVITSGNKKQTKFHDFQIHKFENVNLDKNSRALFNIFEEEVPYKHIYECELKAQNFNNSYNNNRNNEESNIVFHSIQIENTTKALLSKGSVFIFDDIENENRPIAQSKMTFIPESAQGSIKLTENNEIEINRNEKITKRQEEEIEFWGRDYYEANMEGTIKIVNYNRQKIELHITSEINGELNGNNSKLEIISQKQPFHSPNQLSKVKWKVILKAGETKEIKYNYKVFVD